MARIFRNLLILTFVTIYLSACATLNKDECKTANWRVIGYEDGANGYLPSRIGQHRSACAEYGIRPDLDAYNNGRAEGLQQYCIPANGYKLGLSGNTYNGACSGYNESQFLGAFDTGKELLQEKNELHRMVREFNNRQEYQIDLQNKLEEKENLIVSGKLSIDQARLLLHETKTITLELGALQESLHVLDTKIIDQKRYIAEFSAKQHH